MLFCGAEHGAEQTERRIGEPENIKQSLCRVYTYEDTSGVLPCRVVADVEASADEWRRHVRRQHALDRFAHGQYARPPTE